MNGGASFSYTEFVDSLNPKMRAASWLSKQIRRVPAEGIPPPSSRK